MEQILLSQIFAEFTVRERFDVKWHRLSGRVLPVWDYTRKGPDWNRKLLVEAAEKGNQPPDGRLVCEDQLMVNGCVVTEAPL